MTSAQSAELQRANQKVRVTVLPHAQSRLHKTPTHTPVIITDIYTLEIIHCNAEQLMDGRPWDDAAFTLQTCAPFPSAIKALIPFVVSVCGYVCFLRGSSLNNTPE